MNVELEKIVLIESEFHIVTVRKTVREVTSKLGFGMTDVTRIVTAASELARNVFRYAGSGCMKWNTINEQGNTGIELTFEDQGPGIADVVQALEDGYTTSNGLGLGLPGTKRLMDELEIKSEEGKGTTVTIRKWLARANYESVKSAKN